MKVRYIGSDLFYGDIDDMVEGLWQNGEVDFGEIIKIKPLGSMKMTKPPYPDFRDAYIGVIYAFPKGGEQRLVGIFEADEAFELSRHVFEEED